ncbi:hypothetical protein Scep_016789 [Stephania cephalantha]|uniref:H/ACA ribonucleoprotein complex subunit 2 n=2 Tax=Magnoliopsida TaxID=3398 RepID=A0AAP0IQ44_9MAGN
MGSDSETEKSQKERKKMAALAPIAKPLAGKKLCKRTFKLVRRASESKCLKRGVKEVVKSIRRGNKGFVSSSFVYKCLFVSCLTFPFLGMDFGLCQWHKDRQLPTDDTAVNCRLCIIAGNISPIDVITHVPILCEEADIPYVYVPSKEDLATAGATKRPTCCVLVLTRPTKGELGKEEQEKLKAEYDQVATEVSELAASVI